MEIPKKESSFFFILFCCKFFIFRYFHKFMFRYHSKKYRPVSTHKKHPFRDASQAWHMAAVLFFCRIFTAVGYRFGKRFPRERLDFSVRVSQSDGCHHSPSTFSHFSVRHKRRKYCRSTASRYSSPSLPGTYSGSPRSPIGCPPFPSDARLWEIRRSSPSPCC